MENKLCPLAGYETLLCHKEKCMWYKNKDCSINQIAQKLGGLLATQQI